MRGSEDPEDPEDPEEPEDEDDNEVEEAEEDDDEDEDNDDNEGGSRTGGIATEMFGAILGLRKLHIFKSNAACCTGNSIISVLLSLL